MNIKTLLKDKLNVRELRIAFAGEFSSGKSTLINALLHKDLLKHSAYETTVIPVRIINVREGDWKKRDVRPSLETVNKNGEVTEGNFAQLPYLTTTSGEREDIISLECVNIYYRYMDVDTPIVLIDTPGLNTIADAQSQITLETVISSHICVYTLQKPRLSQTDIEFLTEVKEYTPIFVFCVGFLDEISYTETQMQNFSHKIKKLFPDILFKTVCVSALKALVGRDKNIKRLYHGDSEEISEERRFNLVNESNRAVRIHTLKLR